MKIKNVNPLSNIKKNDRVEADPTNKDSSKISDKLDISKNAFKEASITSLKKMVTTSDLDAIEKIQEIKKDLENSFKDGKMSMETANELSKSITNLL